MAAQTPLGGTERDEWQRVPAVLEALGVERGSRIADIGAGGGYFTDRLSEAVGPAGRVYAVDIDERALLSLHEWRELEDRDNVEIILGEVDDPRLPYRSLDGALIVNAYHEMTEYPAMLAGIIRALEPSGRLVIVDNPPPDSVTTREAQTERHNLAMAFAAAELEEAGFSLVDSQPRFIELEHGDHTHHHWMLVAERPPLTVPPPATLDIDPAANSGASDFWCAFPGTREELAERVSPPDSVEASFDGGRVKVCYSRPSARERQIMGGLVPYGEPWRAGANEPTLIHLGFPARVAGVRLEPGTYSLYTVPGEEEWQIALNRSIYRNGMDLSDVVQARDVGRGSVRVQRLEEHVETLTLELIPGAPGSGELVLEWERSRVRIPIERIDESGINCH
jgi:ubiquinone/menaquinone biosynthesis C-methylase UbiE